MPHYVLSDVHGDIDRFHAMLRTIDFSEKDTLYILGDLFDRGNAPVPLLEEVMGNANMKMLLGNHEYMCLQCHSPEVTPADIRRWDLNNNLPTRLGLAMLSAERRQAVLDYLRGLPTHFEAAVNGKQYYLVHGFPGQTVHDEVWNRPEPDTPAPIPGMQVIIGHTPVSGLGRTDEEEIEYFRQLTQQRDHLRIYHAPGFIDIDCGCGYNIPPMALACLRLEDGAEFYV